MARSILLQLIRDSVAEVYEAKRQIDKASLLQEHPLLNEPIKTTVKFLLKEEIKGSHSTKESGTSLLENIIHSAKKAAFEDLQTPTLTTSEYLHCKIELTLHTPDGPMSETDNAIIQDL